MEHLDVQTAHRLIRGELEPSEGAEWMGHLRQCSRCRDLLASERAFAAVIELGNETSPVAAPPVEELLARVPRLGAHRRPRWRQPAVLLMMELAVGIGLALLLWKQTATPDANSGPWPAGVPISADLQKQVLVNLSALDALERDPWLADQYEVVRALEQLITERSPSRHGT